MSHFFLLVTICFVSIAVLQYMLIRFMLPGKLPGTPAILASFLLTVAVNSIPFVYMRTNHIFDRLPWWHRELIVFPYTILLVASAVAGAAFLVAWNAGSIVCRLRPGRDQARRRFLRTSARTLVGASLGALAYGTYHENRSPEITRLVLPYNGLHGDLQGFRIIHITDIHAGPLISFEQIAEAVSTVNDLSPDLVVLTGDYINHNPAYIEGCLKILKDLKATAGVFGVYGNHDHYTGIDSVKKGFSKTGISMLSNSRVQPKGLGVLNIMGVEDPVSGWATDALFHDPQTIARLHDPSRFNLLLSHRPGIFRISKDSNVDLTLAGHTHGGQVIIPGVGKRGLSLARFFVTYTHGLYESETNPQVRMYVNRGIGTIIAPTRLFCRPEILEVTLVGA